MTFAGLLKNKFVWGFAGLALLGANGMFIYSQYTSQTQKIISNPVPDSKAKDDKLGDFTLLDHEGNIQMLYRNADAKYVVIIAHGNSCPIVQKYAASVRELKKQFGKDGVVFYMINANQTDDRTSIIKDAADYNYDVPILLDSSQIVSEALGLTRTSEAVVISTEKWKVEYRGAIDDRVGFGVDKQISKNRYLEDALISLLSGRTIANADVPAKGCSITYQKIDKISYTRDIIPILMDKCLVCHSEAGGFPPFFKNHGELSSWASMIKETLITDRMPPYSSDSHYSEFTNEVSLSPQQKSLLVKWINSGLPVESASEEKINLQDAIKKTIKPDTSKLPPLLLEVSVAEPVQIPPKGIPEYQYFQLGEALKEDLWVSAIEVKTTNPRQLHHESLLVSEKPLSAYIEKKNEVLAGKNMPEDSRNKQLIMYSNPSIYTKEFLKQDNTKRDNFVAQIWAKGKVQPQVFPHNTFGFIPKGSYLLLETHHMGSGRAETERTTVKLYGFKSKPENMKRIFHRKSRTFQVKIPANTKKHIVYSKPWAPILPLKILNWRGHLHMRGKAIKVLKEDKLGKRTVIASIPNYFYGWQTGNELIFKVPVRVEVGEKIISECEYDNSSMNPSNPDPNKAVEWGQRHDENEMCLAVFNFIVDR